VLFASESLTRAVRRLELNGHDGLPVISDDGRHLQGRLTSQNVLQAVARHISGAQVRQCAAAARSRTRPARPTE
jgi:predicted transcriptional regulator